MSKFEDPIFNTPEEYELAVKKIPDVSSASVIEYKSSHLEPTQCVNCEYIIDVFANFTVLFTHGRM